MSKDTGGPAYPMTRVAFDPAAGFSESTVCGMTWLDNAAIVIMARNCEHWMDVHDKTRGECAERAYGRADHLLAEKRRREK